jgi:hypothetical protein
MLKQLILLMRHAEKPEDPADPHLSAAGAERAKRLPARIAPILGDPLNFIFAAQQSKKSVRPVETVEPLSKEAGVHINEDFANADYAALAAQLRSCALYWNARIVICWHHEDIPAFAHALGAPPGVCPNPWPSTVFDLILEFEFSGESSPQVMALRDTWLAATTIGEKYGQDSEGDGLREQ